ncbi:hypothetical protein MRQ36_20995 [Micromonospora sp. R77]|uniref:hypothetical protein n=1 Tax=Micromonospora sp. R77 TaxID=2925836 RepID=UPI001F604F65|nr:hypothetical protein [Micromonospora sp. R77]MCI4064910.1 hypothetical protein [Micromonospora sp. R77]
MNEITALRAYGPDAPPADPQVLAAARARLTAEWADASPVGRVRLMTRRRTLLAAAAALVVTAGVGTVVLRDDPPATVTPGSLSLVAFRIPEFPLGLEPRPAGLAAPMFSLDEAGFLAVYLAADGVSDVYLKVSDRRQGGGVGPVRTTTVDGRPGLLDLSSSTTDPRSVALSWERSPDQWVTLVGNGSLATETAVFGLAATVVDQPQPVPLRVRLAPAGWTVEAFKDDRFLTLRGSTPEQTLSLEIVEKRTPDLLHDVMGAQEERSVAVGGREATLIRTDNGWFLETEVPGGAVVDIQASRVLTPEQVITIAEQVSVVRTR